MSDQQQAAQRLDYAILQVARAAQELEEEAINHHNITYTVSAEAMLDLKDALRAWKAATEDFLAACSDPTSDTKEPTS